MIADFADPKDGGFFFTADDHESLLARPKDPYDGALPGANSVAVLDLVALHRATGETRYLELAGKTLDAFSTSLAQNPAAMPLMLVGLQEYLDANDRAGPDRPGPLAEDAPAVAPRRVVTATARLADEQQPGRRSVEAIVILDIKAGWHLYANPTGVEILKPTTLALEPDQPAGRLEVNYPGASQGPGLARQGEGRALRRQGRDPVRFTLSRTIKPGQAATSTSGSSIRPATTRSAWLRPAWRSPWNCRSKPPGVGHGEQAMSRRPSPPSAPPTRGGE